MNLNHFVQEDLYTATKRFIVEECRIPLKTIQKGAVPLSALGLDGKKEANAIANAYAIGLVDDEAFSGSQQDTEALSKLRDGQGDYPGIVIIAIELKGDHYPRGYFAQVTRFINRQFKSTPVAVMFKYGSQLSFANIERTKYKQEWRDGEKVGRVSILRDVNFAEPHSGHLQILSELRIDNKVDSFASLYAKWQEVFSVSVLNKKFYTELSYWYFWAIKHVTFPGQPTEDQIRDKHQLSVGQKDYHKILAAKYEEALHEHKATNVIRLLTRLLFTWFIKEKKLIPDALFDLKELEKNILKEIAPYHDDGMFATGNKDSIYYKAILQNLFFATLNCPIEADKEDTRNRGFRSLETAKGNEAYGKHFGVDWLMRYKKYFKDPDAFLKMVNDTVPFLNGGLFECLDDKPNKIYIDGFSDSMAKGEKLVVPDYLFFGVEEKVDLSKDLGVSNKGTKQAAVKGLINILKAYKFTITENTPIEEDVALDPELLGKVFENLLASYNPETKTTARKQTGSFYTPREIVNYMVDESLIAYLKNAVTDHGLSEDDFDAKLHQLASFDTVNPFEEDKELSEALVHALDRCKILDPACGSGAFPMGVLQKMVHMLQKLDPKNTAWKHLQLEKAMADTEEAYSIENKDERAERLQEINDAFDEQVNNADYARKLFLIENCIYGVDIQPIATQISKLRFFISLVVDQKVRPDKPNFGIRPLPNLETRFVTANTLIGFDQIGDLFEVKEVKELEGELKAVRHKMFSLKSTDRKKYWRGEDQRLRNEMAELLEKNGLPSQIAGELANWDPYGQKESAPFFDPEWMFDATDGFDIVIGNPPYLKERDNASFFDPVNKSSFGKKWHQGKMDFWYYFLHKAMDLSSSEICFITSRYWLNSQGAKKLISRVSKELSFVNVVDIGKLKVFDAVAGHHMVSHFSKKRIADFKYLKVEEDVGAIENWQNSELITRSLLSNETVFTENNEIILSKDEFSELADVVVLGSLYDVSQGVVEAADKISSKQLKNIGTSAFHVGQGVFVLSEQELKGLCLTSEELKYVKRYIDPNDVKKYALEIKKRQFLIYSDSTLKNAIAHNPSFSKLKLHLDSVQSFITSSNKPYGLHRPRKSRYFEKPKIIFKGMFLTPEFDYDESQTYFGMSFSSIIQKSKDYNLKYLLAILNSSFAAKWFYTHGKQRGAGVDIGVQKLRLFPVKKSDHPTQLKVSKLVDLAKLYRSKHKSGSEAIENVIDAVVFSLYFPDHMAEQGIDVLPFVETDMKAVLDGRVFEKLTDPQKEDVVALLHQKWSNPNNEVVKRMAQFKEKSPDILKPILES